MIQAQWAKNLGRRSTARFQLVWAFFLPRPHPFRDRDALEPEPSGLRLPTQVGEAEEVERLGLPDAPDRSRPGGMAPELGAPTRRTPSLRALAPGQAGDALTV